MALALPAGYLAAWVWLFRGWPAFPPDSAIGALPWLLIAATVLAVLSTSLLARRPALLWTPRIGLIVTALWLMLRPLYGGQWTPAQSAAMSLASGGLWAFHAWGTERLAARLPGPAFPLAFAAASAGAAPVLHFAGASSLAQLSLSLCAALLGFAAAGLTWGPCFWKPAAPSLWALLPGAQLAGFAYTFAYSRPAGLLVLVAPAAALAGDLGPARRLPQLPRLLLRTTAAGLVAGAAALLAWMRAPAGAY